MTDNIKQFTPKAPHWYKPAEQATLAALMRDNTAWEQVAAMLTEKDFYDAKHQRIFRTIAGLARQGKPFGVVDLGEALLKIHDDKEIDKYIAALARDTIFSTDHVVAYAEIVKRYALERNAKRWAEIQQMMEALRQEAEDLEGRKPAELDDSVLAHNEAQAAEIQKRPKILPFMREGARLLVYSRPGLGKTMFGLSLAASVVQGIPFMKWPVLQSAEVLYIDGEMSLQELVHDRLDGFMHSSSDRLHILSHQWLFHLDNDADLCLSNPTRQAELKRYLEAHPGIKLVVFDNESCLFPGAESDKRSSWKMLVEPFIQWLNHKGIASLLLHHAGKNGTQYGTSERERPFDIIIKLDQPDNWSPGEGAHFVVRFEKSRGLHRSEVEPFEAFLEADPDKKPTWTVQRQMPPKLKELVAFLQEHGPLSTLEIARKQYPDVEVDYQSKEFKATQRLVYRARDAGVVEQRHFDGLWWVPLDKQIAKKAASPNGDGPPDEAYLEDLAMIQAKEDD